MLRTVAQRQELVRAWGTAGISQARFCARRGIHPATFSTWCRTVAPKASKRGLSKRGVEFAEFKMAVGGMAPIEVVLPNRVTIRLREAALCRELLSLLLREESC